MTSRKMQQLLRGEHTSHQDMADYEKLSAAQHYRRARKAERNAKVWDEAAGNHDWSAAWLERTQDGDDWAAQAAQHKATAESFRRLAVQDRESAPRARQYAREASARARRYQKMADDQAARVAAWQAEQASTLAVGHYVSEYGPQH